MALAGSGVGQTGADCSIDGFFEGNAKLARAASPALRDRHRV
jgi:hypothetical protein